MVFLAFPGHVCKITDVGRAYAHDFVRATPVNHYRADLLRNSPTGKDPVNLRNVLHCEGILLNTVNTYVISNDRTVALVGIEDLIFVNDHDSLLICHKSRAQEIKKVVQALKDKGFDNVL